MFLIQPVFASKAWQSQTQLEIASPLVGLAMTKISKLSSEGQANRRKNHERLCLSGEYMCGKEVVLNQLKMRNLSEFLYFK